MAAITTPAPQPDHTPAALAAAAVAAAVQASGYTPTAANRKLAELQLASAISVQLCGCHNGHIADPLQYCRTDGTQQATTALANGVQRYSEAMTALAVADYTTLDAAVAALIDQWLQVTS